MYGRTIIINGCVLAVCVSIWYRPTSLETKNKSSSDGAPVLSFALRKHKNTAMQS